MMKYPITLILHLLVTFSFAQNNAWTPLLDKNLSQWETYLSFRHKDSYNGKPPVDSEGNLIKPVGYNQDSAKVFSVFEDRGELILHVSGEIYGCVFTKKEYSNYHLKLKVKWGNKKYEPRINKLKDSGVLYHSVGESGLDYWRSWMLGQEFQIMEGHMGDYWNIANSAIDIRAYLSEGQMNSIASINQPFLPFGTGAENGFCARSENRESPNGEWTTLELITFDGKSLHIVNGSVVMVLRNSRYVKDGQSFPLTKGKLQLQSEAAEVLFKDIQIRELQAFPENYNVYFR